MRWLSSALLLLASVTAQADLVTINPADYAPGTNLSNIQPGVTLSHVSYERRTGPDIPNAHIRTEDVVATPCTYTSSCLSPGNIGFGMSANLYDYYRCSLPQGCIGGATTPLLEFTFDTPTDYIAISLGWSADPPTFLAYDSTGALVLNCYWGSSCATWQTSPIASPWGNITQFSLTRPLGDIARIVVGSQAGFSFVHNITYNSPASVPEPATLGLMGLGLLGLGMRRKGKAAV